MRKKPLVTVLLPLYNGAPYVEEAARSVLAQDGDFELLIIDDKSSDRSVEIVGRIRDGRVSLALNEKNMGLTATLNRGLELASGKYVARLDQDDMCLPGRLAAQAAFLDAAPDVALVGCGGVIMDESGAEVALCEPPAWHKGIVEMAALQNPFLHSGVMFRLEAARAVGGYPSEFKYAQDFALWLLLMSKWRTANLPVPLCKIRTHGGQATQNKSLSPLILLETWKCARLARDVLPVGGGQWQVSRDFIIKCAWNYFLSSCPGGRVAIYGAGDCTRVLFSHMALTGFDVGSVKCVLDDNVPGESFEGVRTSRPSDFDFGSVSHVLITSDTWGNEMAANLRRLGAGAKAFAFF